MNTLKKVIVILGNVLNFIGKVPAFLLPSSLKVGRKIQGIQFKQVLLKTLGAQFNFNIGYIRRLIAVVTGNNQ